MAQVQIKYSTCISEFLFHKEYKFIFTRNVYDVVKLNLASRPSRRDKDVNSLDLAKFSWSTILCDADLGLIHCSHQQNSTHAIPLWEEGSGEQCLSNPLSLDNFMKIGAGGKLQNSIGSAT